ncbi:hypothetical protein DESA109040_18820 [Deinococcus saxicola]
MVSLWKGCASALDSLTGNFARGCCASQAPSGEFSETAADFANGIDLDNAVSESFFETLKRELVDDQVFDTREQARRAIFEYIEVYYNRKRLHSTLGHLTPVEADWQALVA